MDTAPKKSFAKGLFQLIATLVGIWFVIWQVTPVLVDNIPALKRYGQVAEDNNIMPSMLYYTDVPVSLDAENNNRNTVRFMPKEHKDVK